jgi:hypothetical protein
MAGFKIPTFEERTAAAREAKQRALDKLRAKPAIDPEVVAARAAAAEAREAAAAERRAAHKAAIEAEKAAKEQARAQAQLEAEEAAERAAAARRPGPAPVLPTPAELKAARDARYAARKSRQRG